MSCPPLRRYHEFWEGRDHALVFLRACRVILYQSTPNFLFRPNTIPKDHSKAVVRHFSHAFLLFIKFRCFQTSYISCIAPLKVHPTLSPQVKYPPFFLVSLIVFPVSLTICIAYWMSWASRKLMSMPYIPSIRVVRSKRSHETLTSEVQQRKHQACNTLSRKSMQVRKLVDEHDEMWFSFEKGMRGW